MKIIVYCTNGERPTFEGVIRVEASMVSQLKIYSERGLEALFDQHRWEGYRVLEWEVVSAAV